MPVDAPRRFTPQGTAKEDEGAEQDTDLGRGSGQEIPEDRTLSQVEDAADEGDEKRGVHHRDRREMHIDEADGIALLDLWSRQGESEDQHRDQQGDAGDTKPPSRGGPGVGRYELGRGFRRVSFAGRAGKVALQYCRHSRFGRIGG